MSRRPEHLILGIDLTSAGARLLRTRGTPVARPFDAERFVRLVRTADRALLDLAVLDEKFLLHPSRWRACGRLDTAVAAARVAPLTEGIGLVAALDTMHLEAPRVAAAIASVDHASGGRSGWQVGCPPGVEPTDARWPAQAAAGARRVGGEWDIARGAGDGTTGPDGLMSVDHDGVRFAVRRGGPGSVPLPQGRPPVVMRVRTEACAVAAATAADVVRLVAPDLDRARALRAAVHDAAIDVGRPPSELRYLAEAYVVLADDDESARARLDLVEALDGPEVGGGAFVAAGTPERLAQVVTDWADVGVADGFLLHPAALDADLDAVATGLVPALQARGRFPRTRRGSTLRESLGLAPAAELVAG